jgi:hypothetical protein
MKKNGNTGSTATKTSSPSTTKEAKKRKSGSAKRGPLAGLRPSVHPKSRWELIDQDYVNKLSPEEKKWLSDFNEEYVGASFNHSGDILHKTKEEKLDCYRRNNSRNRDTVSLFRTTGWTDNWEEAVDNKRNPNPSMQEDTMIELIDKRNKKLKST